MSTRITPDPGDVALLRDLRKVLETGEPSTAAAALRVEGELYAIPPCVLKGITEMVLVLSADQEVAVVGEHEELTTQKAADLLHVSRPHLCKLLDTGVIPSHRVGTHRRVMTRDVLDYRERRSAERRAQLGEVARMAVEIEGELT